jgi:hypothetical protein
MKAEDSESLICRGTATNGTVVTLSGNEDKGYYVRYNDTLHYAGKEEIDGRVLYTGLLNQARTS